MTSRPTGKPGHHEEDQHADRDTDEHVTDDQRHADERGLAKKRSARHRRDQDEVDTASEGSFPASDPPPWTLG